MIAKIISGGQNGSDYAGLVFAKKLGILTGGWAPRNWMTLAGSKPELESFGLLESHGGYAHRTNLNVRDSDGTVRFALNFFSAGEVCTKRAIDFHKKPFFDVSVSAPQPYDSFLSWLLKNNIKVLNVAGNSEHTAPGISDFVMAYLSGAFSHL